MYPESLKSYCHRKPDQVRMSHKSRRVSRPEIFCPISGDHFEQFSLGSVIQDTNFVPYTPVRVESTCPQILFRTFLGQPSSPFLSSRRCPPKRVTRDHPTLSTSEEVFVVRCRREESIPARSLRWTPGRPVIDPSLGRDGS